MLLAAHYMNETNVKEAKKKKTGKKYCNIKNDKVTVYIFTARLQQFTALYIRMKKNENKNNNNERIGKKRDEVPVSI